jgi:uncharacterized protein YdeI (YjbR/CyaY-like superfamily)
MLSTVGSDREFRSWRRAVDEESFSVRFTPRKPKSYWSAVNIRRATELEDEGRMHPAGRAALEARDAKKPERYSFENKPKKRDPDSEKRFRANKRAWAFFQAQAPWYRRTSASRSNLCRECGSARQEAVRSPVRPGNLANYVNRDPVGSYLQLAGRS